jgi:lysine 6-dehydrogenase
MADIHEANANRAADWINRLIKKPIAKAVKVDVTDHAALVAILKNFNGVFSATSYKFNLGITKASIESGCHMIDLGGNTQVVFEQLKLTEQAILKGITIIPDCGLAPGLGNTLAAYGISKLDSTTDVEIRCGGLPQKPKPPLGYKLVFSIQGLTNEYFGKAAILRNGEVTEIPTFSELENLEFSAPVGKCEAFVTTGGSSTCPWTFKTRLKNYDYKTVRYPGHFEKIKCILDLGLLDEEPVDVQGVKVSPREVFHTVVPKKIEFPNDRDLVVLRTICRGISNGRPQTLTYDLIDFHDEATGFSAMERSTAFPAALVLMLSVRDKNKKGVVPLETGLDNDLFMSEIGQLGLKIKSSSSS